METLLDERNAPVQTGMHPEDALSCFGRMMGACYDEGKEDATASLETAARSDGDSVVYSTNNDTCKLRAVALSNTENKILFSCPGLSLQHKSHSKENQSSREQAEYHALSLLSRAIVSRRADASDEKNSAVEANGILLEVDCLNQVPLCVLKNIYTSFTVLVESRLRAYTTFLARHGISLAEKPFSNSAVVSSIQQKLEALLEIGGSISASSLKTCFQVDEVAAETSGQLRTMPLRLKAVFNLVFHSPEAQNCSTVEFNCSGKIVGRFSAGFSGLQRVHIDLNLHELLDEMIEQASHVVSAAVDMTNNAFAMPGPAPLQNRRTDSYLAMPPPPPALPSRASRKRKIGDDHLRAEHFILPKPEVNGLGILSQLASQLPVVSPDLSSSAAPSTQRIPSLELKEASSTDTEEDLSNLSPDQCADIVDGVFDSLDESVLTVPQTKKVKIEN